MDWAIHFVKEFFRFECYGQGIFAVRFKQLSYFFKICHYSSFFIKVYNDNNKFISTYKTIQVYYHIYQIIKMQSLDEIDNVRNIAEKYLMVSENTEFLTNLKRFDGKIKFIRIYDPQQKILDPNLDIHSLYRLIVQVSYILYTCFVKKTTIYLRKDLAIQRRRNGTSQFILQYFIDRNQWVFEGDLNKKVIQYIDKNFIEHNLMKYDNAYGDIVIKQIQNYIQICGKMLLVQQKKLIAQGSQGSQGQQKSIYEGLNQVINKYLKPRMQSIKKPKTVILCLQETSLFRTYSLLLKVINNSIYYAISKNKSAFQELLNTKRKELQIIKMLNITNPQMKKMSNVECYQELELLIDTFFMQLIKLKIIESDFAEIVNLQPTNSKDVIVGNRQIIKGEERKYIVFIRVNEKLFQQFNQSTYKSILQKSGEITHNLVIQEQNKQRILSPQKCQYEIQYIAQKNLICVRYLTNIQLSIENTDIIMYQCNNIPFDFNSVTLELVDKPMKKTSSNANSGKKRQKIVSLKSVCFFSQKQQPLTKILMLIDLVMINAKIIEPQLKKQAVKMEEYWRMEELTEKSKHICNLFIRKVNKAYNELDKLFE